MYRINKTARNVKCCLMLPPALFSKPCQFLGQAGKGSSEADGRTTAVEDRTRYLEVLRVWNFSLNPEEISPKEW